MKQAKGLTFIIFTALLFTNEVKADGLVRLLEVAADYTNLSKQGPETVGSILSSVRLANTLTSNSTEFFAEANKTGGSGYMPRIRYSHQFTDDVFIGLSYTRGADVFYDRTSVGTEGAYIKDKTKTRQYQTGIRIGFGPLDYLADDSFEASLGYEINDQHGPFLLSGMRLPRYDSGMIQPMALLSGNGTIEFHNRAVSLHLGTSSTGDIFGAYFTGQFQYITGSLKLASHAVDASVAGTALTLGASELAYIHFPKIGGFMFGIETGLIVKFTETLGLRLGGYYQFAYMDYGTPKGFYSANGRINEVGIATELTSAADRQGLGFWGATFAVVTKL